MTSRDDARHTHQAVVIGAGPAGLATAATLRRAGVTPLVLERGAAVGSAWRSRYDSLRLHTVRWLSAMPGMRIPREYGRWVRRDDLIRYLEDYCERFSLAPRFGVEATALRRTNGAWCLDTTEGEYPASHVVVATGATNVAHLPDWPGLAEYAHPLVHSSKYRNALPYRDLDVLVVGAGNSGAEIALDLALGGAATVQLAVRTPPNIVRRATLGVPSQLFGIALKRVPERMMNPIVSGLRKVTIPDLTGSGLPAPPGDGFSQFLRSRTIPIIDSGFVSAVRAGRIQVRPGVSALDVTDVIHDDGSRSRPDAVIAATGYRPGLESILGSLTLLDHGGYPQISGGAPDRAAHGIHCVGISVQLSGQLREIGRDARAVAGRIAKWEA